MYAAVPPVASREKATEPDDGSTDVPVAEMIVGRVKSVLADGVKYARTVSELKIRCFPRPGVDGLEKNWPPKIVMKSRRPKTVLTEDVLRNELGKLASVTVGSGAS